jgi:hypothetical protein
VIRDVDGSRVTPILQHYPRRVSARERSG